MGMYTHVRGWIRLSVINFKQLDFDKLMIEADNLSPRVEQCKSCTTYNQGFNFEHYIFIGGEIKDYDDDWERYFKFLNKNLPISEYNLEMKYEENDKWDKISLS